MNYSILLFCALFVNPFWLCSRADAIAAEDCGLVIEEHALTLNPSQPLQNDRPGLNSFLMLPPQVLWRREMLRTQRVLPMYVPRLGDVEKVVLQLNGSTYSLRPNGPYPPPPSSVTVDYAIDRDGKEIFTFTSWLDVHPEIRSFYTHGSDWILEYRDNVVVSGQSQNLAYGYPKLFFFYYLGSHPFSFFHDGSTYGLLYNGIRSSATYDDIILYACCEPGMYNPVGYPQLVAFYARRGSQWYYVEGGPFK